MSPRVPETLLHAFYEQSRNYAFWNAHIYPESENARREMMFRPRARQVVDVCIELGGSGGTMLEVGAAFGTFCEEVAALGYFDDVIALEPTPDLAATCRTKGLRTIESPIETAVIKEGSVDLVAAWEVIGHLFNPSRFLRRLRQILRPGGLLAVGCPNVKGFDAVVLGEDWGAIDHEHLNYFHPASLSLLFDQEGFDVVETLTPGRLDAELDRKSIEDGTLEKSSHPFLNDLLVDRWQEFGEGFQNLLAANCLSSHQWAIGRRR